MAQSGGRTLAVFSDTISKPDAGRESPPFQFIDAKCALCREDRPLRKSHVIPEFMFRPLYDEKHRFWGVSNIPTKRNRIFQKGPREKLLCERCEQRLSHHGSYASEVFFGNAAVKPVRTPTGFCSRTFFISRSNFSSCRCCGDLVRLRSAN